MNLNNRIFFIKTIKNKLYIFICVVLLLSTATPFAYSAQRSMLQGSHADLNSLPRSCQSCHRGMTMLTSGEESICLDCHSTSSRRNQMSGKSYLQSNRQTLHDIEVELKKPYSHPVLDNANIHRSGETLPEDIVNAKRHSECVDCHNPHLLEKDKPFAGISGKNVGNLKTEITKEYELCYKCHSTSANLPHTSTDKSLEFKTTNPSFHPIESEGKLSFVISLKDPYVARKQKPTDISTITCSDCHGSDNELAPKGPHGSTYRGLLTSNYEMEDHRPESEYTYALCYKCHDRASILANDSFPFHALHIQGSTTTSGTSGTSCFTCHDAHGSTANPYLLRFNENIVRENTENKLEYKSIGVAARHGKCSLTCHGVEHKEKNY